MFHNETDRYQLFRGAGDKATSYIRLTRNWDSWRSLFSFIILGVLLYSSLIEQNPNSTAGTLFHFLHIHPKLVAVLSFMLVYHILALWFNSTYFDLSDKSLKTHCGPLPWPWFKKRVLLKNTIKAIEVCHVDIRYQKEWQACDYYYLRAILKDGKKIKIDVLSSNLEQLHLIKDDIEQTLNIGESSASPVSNSKL